MAISNSFLQLICPILFTFYRHCPQTSSVHQSHQCFVQLQHDIPYFIQFLSLSKHASNALFITRLTCATTFRELWTCTPRSLSLYINIPQVPIIYSPCPARICLPKKYDLILFRCILSRLKSICHHSAQLSN